MTAVIYARYSSDNQREESIEGQIRECTAYAEKNGITIVKHYIDRAISAKTDNRPEFQQMIKDSDKKLFDIVLVWKLDRFARNRYDSARYKTQLKKNGVKLMSATEIISEGPEGIILESVLEGYAEYYSADLAEKVVRGQTENILKGRCNGGRGTFGYTLDSERKFHIDPLTSPFVLESFKKYNEGSTMKEIRDWLNENGIKNPVGGAFTYNSVEHMLKNRRYIGELKFRDVVVPDAIPPIIPLELFEDVQEKIAKNKKAPARRKAEDDYLLTTKLFCGYCGALMFGESGTSRTGEVHRYYKCATAKKHRGCKKKTVRKQWLEDLVVNQTMQLVKDDAAMESIIAKVMELQNKENTNIPLYEKQLRDAESGIQNMLNAIQAGILTSSTKERLEQLEETKRELEARIAEEKLAKPKVTEEFIRFWLLRFRKLDMSLKDQRQALVDTFINAIYLYDDKVLITFNYKEGTQTVTFGEATEVASEGNGSDLDCFPAPRKTSTHCVLVFLFVYTMEGARTRRRIQGPGLIAPAFAGSINGHAGFVQHQFAVRRGFRGRSHDLTQDDIRSAVRGQGKAVACGMEHACGRVFCLSRCHTRDIVCANGLAVDRSEGAGAAVACCTSYIKGGTAHKADGIQTGDAVAGIAIVQDREQLRVGFAVCHLDGVHPVKILLVVQESAVGDGVVAGVVGPALEDAVINLAAADRVTVFGIIPIVPERHDVGHFNGSAGSIICRKRSGGGVKCSASC